MATVAKVIELVATSEKSFDDAVQQGLIVASESVRGITGLEVTNWTCKVKDNRVTAYKVTMNVAFGIERGGNAGGAGSSGGSSKRGK